MKSHLEQISPWARHMTLILTLCLMIVLAMVCLGANVPHVLGSQITVLKAEDNGKEIAVKRNSIIEIHLKESGGTGYSWAFQDLDRKHFLVLGVETKTSTDERLTGAPIMKIWRLKAVGEGETQLRLNYFRPWEGKHGAVDRFFVKVRID